MTAKRIISFLMAILMLALVSCSHSIERDLSSGGSLKLTEGKGEADPSGGGQSYMLLSELSSSKDKGRALSTEFSEALSRSAFDYFRASIADGKAKKNILISPLSLYIALAMTACGAEGETLSQMQSILGDISVRDAANYLYVLEEELGESEKIDLEIANSVWIRDSEGMIKVNPDFVDVLDEYFDADAYMAAFDNGTVNDINSWIEDNTDGMIRKMLEEIPDNAVMYLINALVFEAEWQETYETTQLREGNFYPYSGESITTELMYSGENYYLRDEGAQGFIKPYADDRYAFVALLPDSGIDVYEYAESLTGERFSDILDKKEKAIVRAAMPQFSYEYDDSFVNELKALGMTDAFDSARADLSGLGSSPVGNIFLSKVLHKTFIEVSPKGTKAGAATIVEAVCESAVEIIDLNIYQVYLDRPFVYAITDLETGTPIFLGILADLK